MIAVGIDVSKSKSTVAIRLSVKRAGLLKFIFLPMIFQQHKLQPAFLQLTIPIVSLK